MVAAPSSEQTVAALPGDAWRRACASGGPTLYHSAHGVVFVKRSEDPSVGSIVKMSWPVDRPVRTTGLLWTGPSGGVWAELDPMHGDFGWAVVRGPGFGVSGPVLVDPGNTSAMVLIRVHYLGQTRDEAGIVYETYMGRDETVGSLTRRFAKACNLNQKLIMLTKGLPGKQPNGTGALLPADYIQSKDLLKAEQTFESLGFVGEVLLYLVYTGYWEDYRKVGSA